MTRANNRIIAKYGADKCIEAYKLYNHGNMGGQGVGYEIGVTTNTADALIDVGRKLT